jgi:hypothetical protein
MRGRRNISARQGGPLRPANRRPIGSRGWGWRLVHDALVADGGGSGLRHDEAANAAARIAPVVGQRRAVRIGDPQRPAGASLECSE